MLIERVNCTGSSCLSAEPRGYLTVFLICWLQLPSMMEGYIEIELKVLMSAAYLAHIMITLSLLYVSNRLFTFENRLEDV